uniref:Bestrophin homolog n=1 Tax=Romanomermis culicivorax TaxID=13658 RepID=A0A915I2I6_ROMCU
MKLVRRRIGLHAESIPPVAIVGISSEISRVRTNIRSLITHDSIALPLVYTQTVTAAVYGYFVICLFSRQFDLKCSSSIDRFCSMRIYFNLMATVLQFVFYVGWLKVAEVLHKPFGDDEDDVELSAWIKRHIKAACSLSDFIDDPIATENFCNDLQSHGPSTFDKWVQIFDSKQSRRQLVDIEDGISGKLKKYVHCLRSHFGN